MQKLNKKDGRWSKISGTESYYNASRLLSCVHAEGKKIKLI